MKGKLSTLGFVLILSALIISGCGTTTEVAVSESGVKVEAPGVDIAVGETGVEVDVPGVDIAVGESGVEVDVPYIEFDADASNVTRGSGNVVTEDRAVSDFSRVSLTGVGDVIITQGEEESLTVRADDNLMQYIKTEVKNGTLILGFSDEVKNKIVRPSGGIKFHLSVKQVVGLDLRGAGNINASSLDADRLEIVVGGAGDVNIAR